MTISQDTKELIISSSDITEIIGEVVDLRRRGSNYTGLCPFHNEKTPSFSVSQEKGIYKCFGCGKSGNVISFMVDYHGLSYPEALKELARRAGITIIEEKHSKNELLQLSKKELAYEAMTHAADFYHGLLFTNAGNIANQYFSNRGFTKELIRDFKLGYSPDTWESTKNDLIKKGYKEDVLLEAGLIIKNEENNSYYDRFRGRAMFPIYDYMGRVIAFGARTMQKVVEGAKYINSPQTALYDKSKTLYGLFQAKNEIRAKKFAILTEGYADVLSLHLAGFNNTVASSGTALTREQLDLLSRFTKKLYISYDSDSAGQNATEKALELSLDKGFEVYVVTLPETEDPDSIVQKFGGKAYSAHLERAVLFLDFKIERLKESGKLDSPAGKVESIREIIALISKIPDRMLHDLYISRMASLLVLSEFQIRRAYEEKQNYEISEKNKSEHAHIVHEESISNQTSNDIHPDGNKKHSHTSIENTSFPFEMLWDEYYLIYLALNENGVINVIRKIFKDNENNFITDTCKRLMKILWDFSEKSNNLINDIIESDEISNEDKNIFTSIAFEMEQPSKNWLKYFDVPLKIDSEKTLKYLEMKIKLRKIEERKLSIKNDLQLVTIEESIEMLKTISDLDKKYLQLKNKLLEIQNNYNKI